MELQLYQTVLYLAGAVNIMIAFVLVHNNYMYRNYNVYLISRRFIALNYVIFGIGFCIHAYYQLRTTCPVVASALSVSSFHAGGVLFGWSHISLMRPQYLTRKIVVRDLAILAFGLICYWTAVANYEMRIVPNELFILTCTFSVFFAHALFITYIFYHTYLSVRRSLEQMPVNDGAPKWWTLETKRTVLASHHSFVIGCHLIVGFGIGSIVITACFPHDIMPFTALMAAGICVFCFLFYSVAEYGNAIESATNAAEDVMTR